MSLPRSRSAATARPAARRPTALRTPATMWPSWPPRCGGRGLDRRAGGSVAAVLGLPELSVAAGPGALLLAAGLVVAALPRSSTAGGWADDRNLAGARHLHVSRRRRPARCAMCRSRSRPGSSCWSRGARGPGSRRCCGYQWTGPHFHGGTFAGRATIAGMDTRDHGPGELARRSGRCFRTPRPRWSRARCAPSWPSGSRTAASRRPRSRVEWRRRRWRWPSTSS